MGHEQTLLFPEAADSADVTSSTFIKNLGLPVHRWFRYSAGFSATWVDQVVREHQQRGPVQVLDPFAGSGTTLIVAERRGVPCVGVESHPFVARVARAKLAWRSDPEAYWNLAIAVRQLARESRGTGCEYPALIHKCYDPAALDDLTALRRAHEALQESTEASELVWLTLTSILRCTSKAGTAQWQYVLPKKTKRRPTDVFTAFDQMSRVVHHDMKLGQSLIGPRATLHERDAREGCKVDAGFANLVVTSPPYPNNYDYADATRLEMSFFGEIAGWGDLQDKVRKNLVRSCSQHVPEKAVDLEETLASPEVTPIRDELALVCRELAEVRKHRGGKKTYHLMIACYFRDLARVWMGLRSACRSPSTVCFVVGDSAPYGVYVPVIPWLGALAVAAGFKGFHFEKTRDRNVKWKNRKHRVPLLEGRLWVQG